MAARLNVRLFCGDLLQQTEKETFYWKDKKDESNVKTISSLFRPTGEEIT